MDESVPATTALGLRQSGAYLPAVTAMKQRHGGGGRFQVAFCDGHVETLRLRNLFDRRNESVLRRWNNDNLPHLESRVLK